MKMKMKEKKEMKKRSFLRLDCQSRLQSKTMENGGCQAGIWREIRYIQLARASRI